MQGVHLNLLSSPILLQPRPDNSIGHPTAATSDYTTTAPNAPPTTVNAPAITTTNRAINTAASNNITNVHGAAGPNNSRKGGKRGTMNYTSDKVKYLLVLVERVLPAGPDDWELIARLHSAKYPNHLRDGKELKRKFYEHAHKKPQTGNPNISSTDLDASRLKQLINSKVGSTSNFTVDDDTFVEQTDVNIEELLNEAWTETTTSPGDASSSLLLPSKTTVTNKVASVAMRARTDDVASVPMSARAQARKDEVAAVAINARRNIGNEVKEAVEKSSADMSAEMNQMMIQRLMQVKRMWQNVRRKKT
jgi:hypothetical protein